MESNSINSDGHDRAQIQDVIARYAYGVDDANVELVLSCFTADAVVSYRGGDIVVRGQEEYRRLLSDFDDSLARTTRRSTHCMTNILVDIDGDTAAAKTTAMVTMVGDGDWAGNAVQRGLRYTDRLVRVGADWKISQREHVQIWEFAPPGAFA